MLLDCSCTNGWCSANGEVTPEQIAKLQTFLDTLSPDSKIIIANHYPLLPTTRPSHDLLNNELLYDLLKIYPNVHLYLHGHDHHAAIHNKDYQTSACVANSGSISLPSNARFHIIDLLPTSYQIQTLALTNLCDTDMPLRFKIDTL